MSSFLLLTTLNTSCFFIFMTHPLAMGLMLLVQTCLISLLTGCLSLNFWFSYILFLVFLGGMLVLFIYMTSLASNEMFSLSYPMLSTTPIFMGVLFFSMLATHSFNWTTPFTPNSQPLMSFLDTSSMPSLILKLYSNLTSHLTILLACYLFLTLIVVVNITSLSRGPLRTHKI